MNKRLTTIAIAVMLSSAFNTAFAQEKPVANDLDNKFTPDKNSVFGSTGAAGTSSSSRRSSGLEFKNAIKMNFLLLSRSIFALTYERFLMEELSVEGSAGVCFNKDYIFSYTGSEMDGLSSSATSSISLSQIMNRGQHQSGENSYLAASIKLHYNGWYYGYGGYLELAVRRYGNRLLIPNNSYSGYQDVEGTPTVSVKQTNFLLNWGYRGTTGGKIKTSHEVYFGFGLRMVKYDAFEQRETYNWMTGSTDYLHVKTSRKETIGLPMFTCGYILGFGF